MNTSSLVPRHIAVNDNDMADTPSRNFKQGEFFHAQYDLGNYFNLHFTLPQTQSWQEYRIAKNIASCGATSKISKTRETYWKKWTQYCTQFHVSPYLENISPCKCSIILTAFASRFRIGAYGLENQARVKSISDAVVVISKTYELVGKQSLIYQTEGEYILPVKRLIEGFWF